MSAPRPIKIIAHFPGTPRVSHPHGRHVSRQPRPPGTELEPPDALRALAPGELAVFADAEGAEENPLRLASHGRKADLGSKIELIDAAQKAGRSVEIHVFDDPSGDKN